MSSARERRLIWYRVTGEDKGDPMAKLIYSALASADGYVEDAAGGIDWAAPDDEVHSFVNDLERPIGTYLYGRGMYETMRYWEDAHTRAGEPAVGLEYAGIWQAADKIVFSTSLAAATTGRTRIERSFDPGLVRRLKSSAAQDISVGGANLAGQALRAGLVDELHLLLVPAIVGGGKRALPDDFRADLELRDTRKFASGVVYLGYVLRAA